MRELELQGIYDSYTNGQLKQMANQIEDYGMYEVFEELRLFLRVGLPDHFADSIIVNMVIAFNHIKYR